MNTLYVAKHGPTGFIYGVYDDRLSAELYYAIVDEEGICHTVITELAA